MPVETRRAFSLKGEHSMIVNSYFVTGNLGRDPEMSYVPSGAAVTKFSLAVYQGKDKPTWWINVTCWNDLAERVNEKLQKGQEVLVQGRLQMREYEDKQGIKRHVIDLNASSVQATQKQGTSSFINQENDGLGNLDDHPF
jgi:single-strand DNA-binding protein